MIDVTTKYGRNFLNKKIWNKKIYINNTYLGTCSQNLENFVFYILLIKIKKKLRWLLRKRTTLIRSYKGNTIIPALTKTTVYQERTQKTVNDTVGQFRLSGPVWVHDKLSISQERQFICMNSKTVHINIWTHNIFTKSFPATKI